MIISEVLLILCFVGGSFMAASSWLKKKKFYEQGDKLPGPKAYPFFGNLLDFVSSKYDVLKILKIMGSYEGIVRFWLGNQLTVAISDPDYLGILYSSNALMERPDQYKPIEDWVGEGGLVTAGGEQWKKARRILIQAFHTIPPEDMTAIMVHEAKNLITELRKYVGKGFFAVSPIIRKNGCAIITQVGINEPISKNADIDEAMDTVEELTRISILRYLSPVYYFETTFKLLNDGKKFDKLCLNLRDVGRKIVVRKRKDYDEILKRGEKPANCFVYNLFDKFGDESVEELTTHLLTLLVSAVDTSSDTIGFALLMAAIYPEVQEKLYQEDVEVQKKLGGVDLGPSVLHHYEFLDRVVKETLRLYPGFPVTGRSSTEDIKLGDHIVPKGANVLALTYVTNRKEKYFKDANRFDPDRFLPENVDKIHPYAFLPFGTGLRNCAGTKYALLTIKIEIVMLLRAFKLTAEYKTREELDENIFADVVLRDKNHARIKIEPRK